MAIIGMFRELDISMMKGRTRVAVTAATIKYTLAFLDKACTVMIPGCNRDFVPHHH